MIKAEVITACRINDSPKKPGDIVEVDENTFNNLARQNVLKAQGAKVMKIVDAPALAAQAKHSPPPNANVSPEPIEVRPAPATQPAQVGETPRHSEATTTEPAPHQRSGKITRNASHRS